MTVIVIADTVKHARLIAKDLVDPQTYPISSRSIKRTRGLSNVSSILVDESAWPLDEDTLDLLAPHHAPIFRRR